MSSKGYDQTQLSSRGTAHLHFAGVGMGILAPSIQSIDVDEQGGTLTLHGVFGSKQDTVTVDDASVPVNSWSGTQIVTGLPTAGGDVVVSVDGRKSNTVQLTDWKGTFTYVFQVETLQEQFTWTTHWRGDVHTFRTQPGQAPPDRSPVQTFAATDSKCHFQNSGAITGSSGSTTTWSGSGDLPVTSNSSGAGAVCFVGATIDPRPGQTSVNAMVFADAPSGLIVTIDPPGQSIQEGEVPDPAVYSTQPWGVSLTRDDSFNIQAGAPTPVNVSQGSVTGTVSMTWTIFAAIPPPDPDAAK